MLSINRQFVIFGNYNGISFNDVMQLENVIKEFSFQFGAMPDILPLRRINEPISTSLPFAQNRPAFQSIDKRITVFFGTSRIHVEEVDGDSDKYDDFMRMSLKIINAIIEKMEIKINRVAINEQLFSDEDTWMNLIYQNLFKSSHLYGATSDEWQVRIRSKEELAKFSCYANKIVTYIRGSILDNRGKNRVGLIAGYDYNTQANAQILFSKDDIELFIENAISYRNTFIAACGGNDV